MKLTLTTYDSTVCYNAGYSHSANAMEFSRILQNSANEFSLKTGAPLKDIFWIIVDNSDWCKNMLFLFATVSKNWIPTDETSIIDQSYSETWYPNYAKTFEDYISGRGKSIDIAKTPPTRPHKLFRTVIRE